MSHRNTKKIFLSTIVFALLIILGIVAVPYASRVFVPEFSSIGEFETRWKNTDVHDRHRLLKWLLNEYPYRHSEYTNTRLHGLNRTEVVEILGESHNEFDDGCYYYDVGAIEFDVLQDWVFHWLFPIPRWDHLRIEFDNEGRVVNVATTS